MHPPISRPDLVTLLDEADTAAARLRSQLRLPRADLDDLRHDLLLDLIRRLPAFDARRGSIGAFAGIVLRNQASRIAARVARERRTTGGGLLSLDEPAGDGSTLGDRLGGADSFAAWHGRCVALDVAIDASIDLSRALGALQARDLRLCAAMATARSAPSSAGVSAPARRSTAASVISASCSPRMARGARVRRFANGVSRSRARRHT